MWWGLAGGVTLLCGTSGGSLGGVALTVLGSITLASVLAVGSLGTGWRALPL